MSATIRYAERRSGGDRRQRPPWSSRHYWLGGRRQQPRRDMDGRRVYVDRYQPWVAVMCAGIIVLCALDAAFTLALLRDGATELNPVMRPLVEADAAHFTWVKIGVTAAGVLGLAVLHRCLVAPGLRVGHVLGMILILYSGVVAYEVALLNL